jgi:hypothetical protein
LFAWADYNKGSGVLRVVENHNAEVSFAPLGLTKGANLPTDCAVGFILTPLRGSGLVCVGGKCTRES